MAEVIRPSDMLRVVVRSPADLERAIEHLHELRDDEGIDAELGKRMRFEKPSTVRRKWTCWDTFVLSWSKQKQRESQKRLRQYERRKRKAKQPL
ncbi:MAG TPA: hypothetical protein VGP72_22845 [Planctomycetota bacterium]